MNKVLKFLLSIVTTFSITSCGLLSGLNEEENEEGGGFDFGDSGLGTTEDTTPASNNTPSSDNPSSSGGESQGETTETKYRINFYNGVNHLGYLDLKGGTKVTVETYTPIPTYPSPSSGFDYTFVGWSETRQNNDLGSATTYTVSKNTNLYAVYSRKLKQYSVNFKYGTTDLGSQDFPYGTTIGTNNTYGYDNQLTKTEAGKTYTFIGWNKERQNNDVGEAKTYTVTDNLTLFAVFSSETQKYSVTFKKDGANLGSKDFVYGSKIYKTDTFGYDVSKTSTAQYSYKFDGWNETSTATSGVEYTVTRNMTVHAIYTSTTRQYSVTFKNGNTTLKGPTSVNYGVKPTAPSNPSKSETGVTYTFVGWSENPQATSTSSNVFTSDKLPTVSKDTVYYAIFSSSTNTYQITFKNGNTTLKGPTAVNHGVMPSAPTNPTKTEEKNDSTGIKYTYTFAGWSTSSNASAGSSNVYASNNIPVATKDDTYYAIFSKATYYLVTFYNGTTALTSDYYVESGKKPAYSDTPSKQGSGVTYTFIGWNESSTATTGTLTGNLPVVTKKTNYYAIFSSTSTGGGSDPEEVKIETIYSDEIIELFKGKENANNYISKSAEYRVDETEASNYNIEILLDESGDEEFFKLETSNNNLTANITVLDYGRFTYLNIIYKNKTTSEISKIKKVKLLSYSEFTYDGYYINFPGSDYIGIVNIFDLIDTTTSVGIPVSFSQDKILDINNSKYDLVLPPRWGKPLLYFTNNSGNKLYPRRCYFNNNLIRIRFIDIFPKQYVYFEPSAYNFILIEMNYYAGSYDGFFGTNGIFAKGEDHYYFPYTKVQWNNSNYQWDINSFTPFNFKTDYSDKIGTSEFNQITNKIAGVRQSHAGFTN